MDRRRRNRGYNKDVSRTPLCNQKPFAASYWVQTVPSWEKNFCSSVCRVPWNKIEYTKMYMYWHQKVIQWDDSAAEEAFHNAKSRYYAQINGLPCDIEFPDPNLYIDEINWDCTTDPELIFDLEGEQGDHNKIDKNQNVVIFGDDFLQDHGFSSTGWGDITWDHRVGQNNGLLQGNAWKILGENSWGLYDYNGTSMGGYGWGVAPGYSRWEAGGWYDPSGWYQYGNYYVPEYVQDHNGIYNTWYTEDGNKRGNTTYMPSYNTYAPEPNSYTPVSYSYGKTYDSFVPRSETPRFRGNSYRTNRPRRSTIRARNRVNFVTEQPLTEKWTPSGGKMTNSSAPVNNQASPRGGVRWSTEKPVS